MPNRRDQRIRWEAFKLAPHPTSARFLNNGYTVIKQEGTMLRERALKVVLVLVGLLFVAAV